MKSLLVFVASIALFVGLACGQGYENLTVFAHEYDTGVSLWGALPAVPRVCGVQVAVFISDPAVEAIIVTVYYVDAGRELSRTQLVDRQYKANAAWTNALFALSSEKPQIRSILVVPLKPAAESKTVGMGIN